MSITPTLSDPSEVLDTPADGEFRMYAGGTTMDEVKDAPNAITTFLLQPTQLDKTKKFVENTWNQEVPKLNIPMGVEWTDEFLMKVSEAHRQADSRVPGQGTRPPGGHDDRHATPGCTARRWRSTAIRTSSWAWSRSCWSSASSRPTSSATTAASVGTRPWRRCSPPPFGVNGKVYPGDDLWHLRSLCFTDKPDFLIGNSYGKYIQRDTLHKGEEFEVPLIRLGFPIFDRHHLHRQTTLGYEGACTS